MKIFKAVEMCLLTLQNIKSLKTCFRSKRHHLYSVFKDF